MSEIESVYRAAQREAQRAGVQDYVQSAHAWATVVLWHWGFDEPARPDITSGFRSPMRQRALLDQWESGSRLGLRAKPACQSYHTTGWAIDVTLDVGFPWYAWLLVRHTGAVDGRTFSDAGHFDWRQWSQTPINICEV